jgi:hypothetical protein
MFQPSPSQSSSQAMIVANKLPILKFYSNPTSKKFYETIKNSLVLHDDLGLGQIYIQTHLHKIFPICGWSWIARALPQNRYLVEPSNIEWKSDVISQGELVLGSVRFIVEPYDFSKFDGGFDPILL